MKKTDQGQPRRLRLVPETSPVRREEARTSGDVPSTCRGVSQGRSRLPAFQSRLSQRRQKDRFQGMRASRLRRTRSRLSQGFQRTRFSLRKRRSRLRRRRVVSTHKAQKSRDVPRGMRAGSLRKTEKQEIGLFFFGVVPRKRRVDSDIVEGFFIQPRRLSFKHA